MGFEFNEIHNNEDNISIEIEHTNPGSRAGHQFDHVNFIFIWRNAYSACCQKNQKWPWKIGTLRPSVREWRCEKSIACSKRFYSRRYVRFWRVWSMCRCPGAPFLEPRWLEVCLLASYVKIRWNSPKFRYTMLQLPYLQCIMVTNRNLCLKKFLTANIYVSLCHDEEKTYLVSLIVFHGNSFLNCLVQKVHWWYLCVAVFLCHIPCISSSISAPRYPSVHHLLRLILFFYVLNWHASVSISSSVSSLFSSNFIVWFVYTDNLSNGYM